MSLWPLYGAWIVEWQEGARGDQGGAAAVCLLRGGLVTVAWAGSGVGMVRSRTDFEAGADWIY